MVQAARTAVVISGDVVGSTELEPALRARLNDGLREASQRVLDLLGPALPLPAVLRPAFPASR